MKLIKRENGFIVTYQNSNKEIDGWEVVSGENAQEVQDFINKTGDYSQEAIFERISTPIEKRKNEYGTIEEQLEYIVENGLEAFITRQNAIKAKYPKE